MLHKFGQIVGKDMYSAFIGMLKEIGPAARTHRISVVIAGMLKYARSQVSNTSEKGTLAWALIVVEEKPYSGRNSDHAKKLWNLVDSLCEEAGMQNRRQDYRGASYSIADSALAEYSAWYNMPWQSY